MSSDQMNSFNASLTSSEDPNHEVYLRTCFVCGETSKPGHDFIRNYGGVVCFGCRAFFRRSHQNNKTANYVCKSSGGCNVTAENRRNCKSCRYDRCLKAGMRPDLVLSEDQKLVRFRKVLSKKKRISLQTQFMSKAPPSLLDSNNYPISTYSPGVNNYQASPVWQETASAMVYRPQAAPIRFIPVPLSGHQSVSSTVAFPHSLPGYQDPSMSRRPLPEPRSSAALAESHEEIVSAYMKSAQQHFAGKLDQVKS